MLVTLLFTSGLLLGWLVGYTLLGVATIRARVLTRWCGVLVAAQLPLVIFLMAFYGAGGLALGLIWVALGYALLSGREKAAKRVGNT